MIANTALIPTHDSALYPTPGVDLIIAATEDQDWQHLEWLPAGDADGFDWDWEAQLAAAGWTVVGPLDETADEYDAVRIERR